MKYYKYPRTPHLPWSPGSTSDDKTLKNVDHFKDARVVVTKKMDGENTSMYRDKIHARSLDSRNHPSRNWVKKFWGDIRYLIPEGKRICGENIYARHSIAYKDLPSYFLGFSMWEDDICLSWGETISFFNYLDIISVEVLYEGIFDEEAIKAVYEKDPRMEGYVIRKAGIFNYFDFHLNVAKFVRHNHVQTNKHWMHQLVLPNHLSSD